MQIVRAAPPAARRARINARVNVRCDIRPDSRLENCVLLNENPSGMGFGDAGLRIAETLFRFAPPMRDGQPLSQCRIPLGIQFNLGGPPPSSGPLEG
jgi:protein TonB